MSHYVDSDGSDYFVGWCRVHNCPLYPCVSCVEAQERIEERDRVRSVHIDVYYALHRRWPPTAFIDDAVELTGDL